MNDDRSREMAGKGTNFGQADPATAIVLPGLRENLPVSNWGAVALWDNRIAGNLGVPKTLAGI